MSTVVSDNAWKISFVILIVQDLQDMLGSITCAHWLLGCADVLLECPGNARFELQLVNVPHGQEDLINGDVLLFDVQNCTYIMQGLLVRSCSSWKVD